MSGGNLRLLERCKERLRELQRIITSRDEVDNEPWQREVVLHVSTVSGMGITSA